MASFCASVGVILLLSTAAFATDDTNPFVQYEENCPTWDIQSEMPPENYPLAYRDVPPDMVIPAFWQASYPGSGADMNGALIRGLTGLGFEYVSDIERLSHLNDPGDRTLSVKSHYPRLMTFPPEDFNPHEFMDSLVLVLRHPMNAIPSFLNVSKNMFMWSCNPYWQKSQQILFHSFSSLIHISLNMSEITILPAIPPGRRWMCG